MSNAGDFKFFPTRKDRKKADRIMYYKTQAAGPAHALLVDTYFLMVAHDGDADINNGEYLERNANRAGMTSQVLCELLESTGTEFGVGE